MDYNNGETNMSEKDKIDESAMCEIEAMDKLSRLYGLTTYLGRDDEYIDLAKLGIADEINRRLRNLIERLNLIEKSN